MGKRKGDDVLVRGPALVGDNSTTTIHSHNSNSSNNNYTTNHHHTNNSTATAAASSSSASQPTWMDSATFDHKLWVVRESLKLESCSAEQEDDFLAEVRTSRAHQTAFQHQQEHDLVAASNRIQERLRHKLSTEEAKCQEESATVATMEHVLEELAQEREALQQEQRSLEDLGRDLEQRIASAMEEANQQVESIDMVEESRKNQVPRLKHQISLYASTTGIKWNFDNEELLEGHVTIPSKEVAIPFSIDPSEHTRYEVANQLWRLMDPSTEED